MHNSINHVEIPKDFRAMIFWDNMMSWMSDFDPKDHKNYFELENTDLQKEYGTDVSHRVELISKKPKERQLDYFQRFSKFTDDRLDKLVANLQKTKKKNTEEDSAEQLD